MDPRYESRPGNYIESSGSAMFVYGLFKGLRNGYSPATPRSTTPLQRAGMSLRLALLHKREAAMGRWIGLGRCRWAV